MEIKHENRLLFLKIFTQELIANTEPKIMLTINPAPEKLIQSLPLIKPMIRPTQQMPRPRFQPRPSPNIEPSFPIPTPIQPDLQGIVPEGFGIGKLNSLLEDPTINMIECPGPGKLILVRSLGNIKATKISLNEQEVKEIIENFAQQTRIPIMTGIFKAAVGNILITAIISEFVGSRFIITRKLG